MKKKCLIIEPHSDDSLIAAGGYLLKYQDEYEYYFCLVTASDLNMRHKYVERKTRIAEYKEYVRYFSGTFIGAEDVGDEFPVDWESKLDLYPRSKLVKKIEDVLDKVNPDVLMVMGPSFHHDHTCVYEAVVAATRPTVMRNLSLILLMENATYSHELYDYKQPNMYVELSEELLLKKLNIFDNIFKSQARNVTNILSNDGMSRWANYRGVEARCHYAEAFVVYFKKV